MAVETATRQLLYESTPHGVAQTRSPGLLHSTLLKYKETQVVDSSAAFSVG